jgi:hypothetical protein
MWFPYVVYGANLAFAIVLAASVSLWIPILLSLVLGLLPATFALSGFNLRLPQSRQVRLSQDA